MENLIFWIVTRVSACDYTVYVLDFLKCVFYKIDYWLLILSTSNLIFTACVACKDQVPNRQKIKFKNQVEKFCEIDI